MPPPPPAAAPARPEIAASERPLAGPLAPPAENEPRDEARRFARLLVSEIKLYNEDQVAEGREQGNLYARHLRHRAGRRIYRSAAPTSARPRTTIWRSSWTCSPAGGEKRSDSVQPNLHHIKTVSFSMVRVRALVALLLIRSTALADIPMRPVTSDFDAEFARAADLLEQGDRASAEAVLAEIGRKADQRAWTARISFLLAADDERRGDFASAEKRLRAAEAGSIGLDVSLTLGRV